MRLAIVLGMKTMAMIAMCALLLGGCTAASNAGSPNGAGAQGNGGAASGVSCKEILDCVGTCADNDDACVDACIAKGTPDAQAKANQLKSCIAKNACSDSTCLQSKCSAELTTCAQDTGSSAAPAKGSVPSDLVGSWDHNGTLIAFRADGAVHRQEAPYNGCSQGYEDGVAVASGSSLTLSFTTGAILICGNPSGKPYTPVEEHYTYAIEAHPDGVNGPYTVLTLTNTDCNPDTTVCTLGYDRVK